DVGAILYPPEDSLQQKLLRFPILSLILLIGLPNVIMSLGNIAYNWREIVAVKQSQQQIFSIQVGLLNLFAYGTGLSFCALHARPIGRWLNHPEQRDALSQTDVCQRTMGIGYCSAITSMVLWLVCGILFPLGLHWWTGEAVLNDYVHFMASHVINGALAAIGVFYLVAHFAIEQLLPRVINIDTPDLRLRTSLERMDKAAVAFVGAMIVVPFSAILFAVAFTQSRLAFGVIAVTGMIGVGFAYRWAGKLKSLIATFKKITSE
ncbi:MAG TPA: hypothetical protein VMM56_05200, partial [Planctomycetaceae bacterium]|nr:hypothetical protein [Planctomycetaceae bacterium]